MGKADLAFVGSIPELYGRYLGPFLFEPFARDLAERFRSFSGELLEVAAGAGQVTRALAETVDGSSAIVATDLNEPMLARARDVVRAANVHWRQADAQALPFAQASFDAVVCQFGMMFLPDKPRGFSEARRVLRPQGRFVFSVWDRLEANDVSSVAQEALAALFSADPPSFFRRVPFAYYDEARIRGDLALSGFTAVEIERVTLPTLADSAADAAVGLCMGTPLRTEIEARGTGALQQATETVTAAIESRFGTGPIRGSGQALVVTATAERR